MRWQGRRQSSNVTDKRGIGPGTVVGGGVGTVVLALLVYFLGGDPSVVIQNTGRPTTQTPASAPQSKEAQREKEFVAVVLADTEEVWNKIFRQQGSNYQEPELVLFTDRVQSACGIAGAAVGPFYCPADEKIYIDLSFFEELHRRFGAPGDFAQAYVIAHEVGHHIQNQLGISDRVRRMQQGVGKAQANRLSVKLELQADYLAGVWAHHARRMASIDAKDIEEAMGAASAIGDDRLQKQAQGHVVPESFTHGTSAQRVRAFTMGWKSGDLSRGDLENMPAS